MTKSDRIRREGFRLRMVELQEAASMYSKKIQVIDAKDDQKKRDRVLGKCFKKDYGYCRVEYFDKHGLRPYGTVIHFYGRGKERSVSIELNHWIYDDVLEPGQAKTVHHSVFVK